MIAAMASAAAGAFHHLRAKWFCLADSEPDDDNVELEREAKGVLTSEAGAAAALSALGFDEEADDGDADADAERRVERRRAPRTHLPPGWLSLFTKLPRPRLPNPPPNVVRALAPGRTRHRLRSAAPLDRFEGSPTRCACACVIESAIFVPLRGYVLQCLRSRLQDGPGGTGFFTHRRPVRFSDKNLHWAFSRKNSAGRGLIYFASGKNYSFCVTACEPTTGRRTGTWEGESDMSRDGLA